MRKMISGLMVCGCKGMNPHTGLDFDFTSLFISRHSVFLKISVYLEMKTRVVIGTLQNTTWSF